MIVLTYSPVEYIIARMVTEIIEIDQETLAALDTLAQKRGLTREEMAAFAVGVSVEVMTIADKPREAGDVLDTHLVPFGPTETLLIAREPHIDTSGLFE